MDLDDKLNQIKIRDIIIIYLLSILIISGLIFIIIKLNHKNVGDFIIGIVVFILQLLICLMLLLKIKPSKEDIKALYNDFKKKIKKREIIEVTFIKLCIAIGGSKLVLSIFYFIDPILVNDFIYQSTSLISSGKGYIINFILLAFISPIVEEIVFRGVMLNRITEKFSMCSGIVVSSMIFASFYAGSGIAGALVLGIINSILYIKYRNILFPIVVNSLNNIVLLILAFPLIKISRDNFTISYNDILMDIIFGIILCFIGCFIMIKYIGKNKITLNKYDKYIRDKKGIY